MYSIYRIYMGPCVYIYMCVNAVYVYMYPCVYVYMNIYYVCIYNIYLNALEFQSLKTDDFYFS